MSKVKQVQKAKKNSQVGKQEQSTSNSVVKTNPTSVQIEALVGEEQRLLNALRAQQQSQRNRHDTVESLSTALIQSLATKDQQVISLALANDDQQLIKNTVKSLPSSKVTQLLESIQQAILGKPYNTHFYSKWLKHLLTIHTTTLLSKSNLLIINNLKGVLSARTNNIQEISKLKGKLSIVVGNRKQGIETKLGKKGVRQTGQNQDELDGDFDGQMEIEELGQQDEE